MYLDHAFISLLIYKKGVCGNSSFHCPYLLLTAKGFHILLLKAKGGEQPKVK